MMRAFISHSSKDKTFAAAVARELGRQFCTYDEYSFSTGDEFREAIRRGLDNSSIFVLIASKNSLSSPWVKFEQDEAELRLIQGSLSRILVFVMPDGTSVADLPEWMRRAKVSSAVSAKAIVREIQQHIQDLYVERQQPIYVGRRKEHSEAEEKLLTITDSKPHRNFMVWGLTGIGRRTFCARVAQDLFNLRKHYIFRIQDGDDLRDIVIQLADAAEVVNDLGDFKRIVEQIRAEKDEEVLNRARRYIEAMVSGSTLPIFVDLGGAIDANGSFTSAMAQLLLQCTAAQEIYSANVLSRKPTLESLGNSPPNIPSIRIEPLSPSEMGRLVGRLVAAFGVSLTREEIKDISDYLRGYPPAAHFAADLIKTYGPDAILNNKVAIATFQSRRFVAHLKKHSALEGLRSRVLAVLAYYSPLPLRIIGESLRIEPHVLSDALSYLIDISLVIPEERMYRIADPVIDSVLSEIDLGGIPHKAVAASLDGYLAEASQEDDGMLALARSLRRARLYAGLSPSQNEIAFVSDLIYLQQRAYHGRDYESSIRYGRQVLMDRPDNVEVRSYLARALAQRGDYGEALEQADKIRQLGVLHDAYYVRGFVERLRGNHRDAIEAYAESLRRGRRGLAVHRELALCYFLVNNLQAADEHLKRAEAFQPDNRYVVDLQVQIATRQRDRDAANRILEILKAIDKVEFYQHRKSTVDLAFGDVSSALESIKSAISLTDRPTVAMLAQAAKCAIEARDFASADMCISLLRDRYPRRSASVILAIECRYKIAQGNYEDAFALLESKIPKDSTTYVLLRLKALNAVLGSEAIDEQTRRALESERDALETKVERENIVDIEADI